MGNDEYSIKRYGVQYVIQSISSRKVTQLTHCTSSIEAPAASDIDFDFNQTNL